MLIFSNTYFTAQMGTGMMDKDMWEAYKWIRNNTEVNAKIFWFYSVPIVQDFMMFPTKRIPYKINIEEYVNAIRSNKIKTVFNGTLVFLPDTRLPYRTSLFSYKYHVDEEFFKNISKQTTENMDYFVFGLSNIDNVAINYNKMIISKLLEMNKTLVFQNNAIAIVKNR